MSAAQEQTARAERAERPEHDAACHRPGGMALTLRGLAHMALPPGAVVADMGCGAGESVRHLRSLGYAALGLDKNRDAPRALDGPPFPRMVARAEAPPLAAASCHALLCECVLCLLPEPERALRAFAEILRSDGYVLISDIYATHPAGCGTGQAFLSRPALEAALTCAGFAVTHFEDHSPALRDYAAQLLWRGAQSTDDCRLLTAAKGCGYGLWIAKKD